MASLLMPSAWHIARTSSAQPATVRLFSHDAIIVWQFRSFDRKRQPIRRWSSDPAAPPVLRFTSSRQTEEWLSGVRN
jgi:hypothetical protein